jgi:hypothetical protein
MGRKTEMISKEKSFTFHKDALMQVQGKRAQLFSKFSRSHSDEQRT